MDDIQLESRLIKGLLVWTVISTIGGFIVASQIRKVVKPTPTCQSIGEMWKSTGPCVRDPFFFYP